ncbi:hypothetical protein CK203_037091 [Vitis vinifera]|uniref:Uncharacterized protein n=1 Tax=Vitis vinifera TaxID=29760 RepID=A0A438I5X2_VITVI|nr:hypothetical protein CK203_037091 [Vitis vinifera]
MGWSCSRVGALWMPGTLQGALWYYGMRILELLDQKWMLFQCHVILDDVAVLKLNLLRRSNFRMGRFVGESFGGRSSNVGVSPCEFGGDMLEAEIKVPWSQEGDWRLGISSAVLTATVVTCQGNPVGQGEPGKCSPSNWYMVLGLNPATDDTLNLFGADCCGVVNTPKFGSP